MIRVVLWSVTLLRIVLIPVFLVVAVGAEGLAASGSDPSGRRLWAVAVLVAIGISDILDGWIARRYDLASQAGAVVDAAADKLVQVVLVAFFTFGAESAFARVPLWFFGLLVARDLVLGGGALAIRASGTRLRFVHRWHGRAASVCVFAILFWITAALADVGLTALLVLATALLAGSSTAYALNGLRQARDSRA